MAIVWSGNSGHMYIGIEAWVVSGPHADGKVIVHADYYIQAEDRWAHHWTYPWYWSGTGGSGSQQVRYDSTTTSQPLVKLPGWDVAVWAEFGRATTATFNASLGPIWNGGTPSVSVNVTIPARPYQAPSTPSNVKGTRVNDNRIDVSWSAISTTSAPVLGTYIERRTQSDMTWRHVADVGGSARSWTDTAVRPNERYWYRVWTHSGTLWSGAAESSGISTTPAAPYNVVASKTSTSTIEVTWLNAAPYAGTGYRVYDNGNLLATVPSGQTRYVHNGASTSITHTYSVEMLEEGGLVSVRSGSSNTVQLLAPPNAPTPVDPTGVHVYGFTIFRWKHNPTDSSTQQAAQVQYRTKGSSSWTTISATQFSNASATLNPGYYEWQVRTRGLHMTYSPWSPIREFRLVSLTKCSVTSPANNSTVASPYVTVKWVYTQAEGGLQASADVELIDESLNTVERLTVYGTQTSVKLKTLLVDGKKYTVRVRARSEFGLESDWSGNGFTVSFPAPPAPTAEAVWETGTESMRVTVSNPAPLSTSKQRTNYIFNPSRFTDTKNWWPRLSDLGAANGRLRLMSAGGKTISVISQLRDIPAVSTGMWCSVGARVSAHESAKVQVGVEFHTGANAFVQSIYSDMSTASDLSLVGVVPDGDISRARLVIRAECEGGLFPAISGDKSKWEIGKALTFTPDKDMTAVQGSSMERRLLGRAVNGINVTGRVGHKIRIRATAKSEKTGTLALGFYGLNDAGTYIRSLWNDGNGSTQDFTLPVGTSYEVYRNSVTITQAIIDAGVTQIVPCVYIPDGGAVNSLSVVDEELSLVFVESAILRVGQTQEDVQDTTHFDGSMGPNLMLSGQSYAVSWNGTPNDSVSYAVPNSQPAVRNTIERSVTNGITWESFSTDDRLLTVVNDPDALKHGTTLYRVTAFTEAGASTSTVIEGVVPEDAPHLKSPEIRRGCSTRQVWFSVGGKGAWFPSPQVGMTANNTSWGNNTQLLNGMNTIVGSTYASRIYNMSWNHLTREQAQQFQELFLTAGMKNVFFLDPFANQNILSQLGSMPYLHVEAMTPAAYNVYGEPIAEVFSDKFIRFRDVVESGSQYTEAVHVPYGKYLALYVRGNGAQHSGVKLNGTSVPGNVVYPFDGNRVANITLDPLSNTEINYVAARILPWTAPIPKTLDFVYPSGGGNMRVVPGSAILTPTTNATGVYTASLSLQEVWSWE